MTHSIQPTQTDLMLSALEHISAKTPYLAITKVHGKKEEFQIDRAYSLADIQEARRLYSYVSIVPASVEEITDTVLDTFYRADQNEPYLPNKAQKISQQFKKITELPKESALWALIRLVLMVISSVTVIGIPLCIFLYSQRKEALYYEDYISHPKLLTIHKVLNQVVEVFEENHKATANMLQDRKPLAKILKEYWEKENMPKATESQSLL